MFNQKSVNLEILKKRAYNSRWASVPEGVIPLTAADPDFPCAPEIAEAICRFAKDRYFSYGPPEGLPEFKESVAGFFQSKRDIPASPEFIFPVDSAAYGIYLTCKAFLSAGQEAIIFDPVDFLFRYSIESVGGKAIPFSLGPEAKAIDYDRLEGLITGNTRLICLCNPLNPTGKVFTKEELTSLGELACKHNLVILSDEIWSDIVFKPHNFTSISSVGENIRSRTVTITGFSKSYGLAGLRIGAVMASNEEHFKKLIDASMHHSTIHGANVLSQEAAVTALNDCQGWLNEFVLHLHTLRERCVKELNAVPGFRCHTPEGCYVAFANITGTGKTSQEVYDLLMEEAQVAVVPGLKQWFGEGAEGYIRISFATSEEMLTEAITRIRNTFNNFISIS